MASVATGSLKLGKSDKFSPASTFIELIEYDPEGKTMDVTFRSGSKFRYLQVYPSTFQSFKQSPTHSAYYARAIKGNLPSTKLVDHSIGRNESGPLKKVKDRKTLDEGVKKENGRAERINGTVNRAFAA